MISRFYSTGVGLSIIVATVTAIIFASVPASSQSSSCEVSPSSDWDFGENPRDYLSIDIPGSGGGICSDLTGDRDLGHLTRMLAPNGRMVLGRTFRESKWITVLRQR